jgi:hypothetical protein
VVADSFYGRSHEFREWLEEQGCPYAVMVPKTNAVALGARKKKIEPLAERLPEDGWWQVHPVRDISERRPMGMPGAYCSLGEGDEPVAFGPP